MTTKEKIQHADAFSVNLYGEGIFWVAYEQSAFAVQQVKPYCKVNKWYEKSVGDLVVSVGITDDELEEMLPEFDVVYKDDWCVNLRSRKVVDLPDFKAWKMFLPTTAATTAAFFEKYELSGGGCCQGSSCDSPCGVRERKLLPLTRRKRKSDTIKQPDTVSSSAMFDSAPDESAADLSAIADKLRAIDLSVINPIEALMFLSEIKKELV